MSDRYQITGLLPTGHDAIWKADLTVRVPEMIGDINVAQVVNVTVRFYYPHDGSVEGLLDAAHSKAIEAVASVATVLASSPASVLREEYKQHLANVGAEIIFPPMPPIAF